MMTTMITTFLTQRLHKAGLALLAALLLTATPALADTYYVTTSSGSGNKAYTTTSSGSSYSSSYSGGNRSYPAYYRSGNGGFGWLNYNRGRSSSTGYQGAGGANNTPHRSDWYAKLQAQRRWDEQQFKKMQARGGAECGLSGAPAYCYKLMKPYPTEIRIVRY